MSSVARSKVAQTHRFSWRMRAVALVLCLVTWRGPLPWLHDHETDPQAAAGDLVLARHLASYHAPSHEPHAGWHVHLLLPFGRCPCADPDEKPSPPDPLSLYGTLLTKSAAVPASTAVHSAWCEVPAAGHLGVAVGMAAIHTRPPPNAPASFLASLLLQAPLRALTGVALC